MRVNNRAKSSEKTQEILKHFAIFHPDRVDVCDEATALLPRKQRPAPEVLKRYFVRIDGAMREDNHLYLEAVRLPAGLWVAAGYDGGESILPESARSERDFWDAIIAWADKKGYAARDIAQSLVAFWRHTGRPSSREERAAA